jgi:Ras-related protein Rab-18
LIHVSDFLVLFYAVYDVTRKETFEHLNMWLQEVEQYSMGGGKEVVKLLVGNKVDLTRQVSREDAMDWAKSKGMLFLEASAKTKAGINQVFNEVVLKILENPALLANTRPAKPKTVNVGSSSSSGSGGCC